MVSFSMRVWWLGLVAAGLVFLQLGSVQAFRSDDEFIYLQIAEEMWARGDLWVPTWFGRLAFYKPPLTYWLSMLGFTINGVSLLSARIPVALCGLATLAVLYLLAGRMRLTEETGRLACLLFMTTVGCITFSKVAMMDMPMVCVMTAAMYCLYRERIGWFLALAGASTLIKGPVAPAILLLAASGWWVYQRRGPAIRRDVVVGAAAGLLMVVAWPVMLAAQGLWPKFVSLFLVAEHVQKFKGILGSQPVTEFLGSYLIHAIPWSFLFVAALICAWQDGRYKRPEVAFSLIWIGASAAVFLVSRTKLQHYVLPALPAAALLMAVVVPEAAASWVMRGARLMTCVLFILFMVVTGVVMRISPSIGTSVLLLGCTAAAAWAAVEIVRGRLHRSAWATVTLAFLVVLVRPAFPINTLPAVAIERLANLSPVGSFQYNYPYSYWLKRKVECVETPAELVKVLDAGGAVILSDTQRQRIASKGPLPDMQSVLSWRGWIPEVRTDDIVRAVLHADAPALQEEFHIYVR